MKYKNLGDELHRVILNGEKPESDLVKQIASILKICTNETPIIDIKSTGVVHNNTVISPKLLREAKRYSSGEQN